MIDCIGFQSWYNWAPDSLIKKLVVLFYLCHGPMLFVSCFCSIFRQTSGFCTLHSRLKQCKHVLDFSWNPSWNFLEICSVKFVDTWTALYWAECSVSVRVCCITASAAVVEMKFTFTVYRSAVMYDVWLRSASQQFWCFVSGSSVKYRMCVSLSYLADDCCLVADAREQWQRSTVSRTYASWRRHTAPLATERSRLPDPDCGTVFHRTWKTLTYRTMNSGGR